MCRRETGTKFERVVQLTICIREVERSEEDEDFTDGNVGFG